MPNENFMTQLNSLKAFVKELFDMADWPIGGGLDAYDFQDSAVKYGVLVPEQRFSPCGEDCNCQEYYGDDEFKNGITCYRLAPYFSSDAELRNEAVEVGQTCPVCGGSGKDPNDPDPSSCPKCKGAGHV